MKIIQINAVNRFGSTGRNTMEFHNYCKSHGITSSIFCMNESKDDDNIYLVGTNYDHKLHALFSRIFGLQGYFSHFATKRMLRRIDEIQPDVVFLGNLHSNFVNIPMLLRYLAKKDIVTVLVLHDCWFFTGHCTHYTAFKCMKWQSVCRNCAHMKSGNPSLFFDSSQKVFHDRIKLFSNIPRMGVIGVSDWITEEAKKSVILSSVKSYLRIYNWIDLETFYPRETKKLRNRIGVKDEFIVLGVATEWSWMKGFSHFIEAAKRIPEAKFVLIGSIQKDLAMPENVLAQGVISNVLDLAEYYSLADVLLVCSLQETFGKVSAEALACGTPVIANDSTANPEIIGSKCGIVVHNNSDDEIESAIRLIMRTGKSVYTQNCIYRAQTEFNKDTQISKYIQYADLLCK